MDRRCKPDNLRRVGSCGSDHAAAVTGGAMCPHRTPRPDSQQTSEHRATRRHPAAYPLRDQMAPGRADLKRAMNCSGQTVNAYALPAGTHR